MLQTIRKEIDTVDAVSFSLFDTLLLFTVFKPEDMLLNNAGEKTGDGQKWDSDPEVINKYTVINPILSELVNDIRNAGKHIAVIADEDLSSETVEHILNQKGLTVSSSDIFTQNSSGKKKEHFELFAEAENALGLNRNRWLHIGSDYEYDYNTPRRHKVRAYFYMPMRDRYLENLRDKALAENTSTEISIPASLTDSMELAAKINEEFSRIEQPDEEVVIRADHVGMMFNMSAEKVDNLKEYLVRLVKGNLLFKEFWALNDISFDIRKGEKVGLIGLNGSGKSTTLKIVSGVMKARRGSVWVKGKVAPLIELGAGFDDKLSARENIYLNGALLGYSRKQMNLVYDQIIEFSELKEFEDIAIKNYSSGMIARLGFAIATSHVPDILIIDEILSVGDYEFQKKCHRRMHELTGQGATVLFVSHSAADIVSMCDRALWLDHGNLLDDGEAEYTVGKYIVPQ